MKKKDFRKFYEVKVLGIYFTYKDRVTKSYELEADDTSFFIDKSLKGQQSFLLSETCPFLRRKDYSITQENYCFFFAKGAIRKLFNKYLSKDIRDIRLHIDADSDLGREIEIDVLRNDYPFNIKRPLITTCQFIDNFFPIIDGVVKTVDNYGKELNKDGYPTRIYTPEYEKGYVEEDRGYPVVRTPSIKFSFIEYVLAKPEWSSDVKYSLKPNSLMVFHAHSPFFMGHYALKMARHYHVPLVATFHSKFYDDFLAMTKSKTIAQWLTNYVVDFFNQCDAVWTVNDGTAQTLRDYGYKGELKVMPNGSNYPYPENVEEIIQETCNKFKINRKEHNILFVAHLIWQKNIKLVLDTIKELDNQGYTFHLRLAGTGGNEGEVKEYASKLGLKTCTIEFLGKIVDQHELQGLYASSDLFFFPSIYDNAPLVLREAATMKLPALLTRGSNSAENIVDGDNGFLAEPTIQDMSEKIKDIFEDEQKMKEVGEHASKTIPVSWDVIMKQVEDEYLDILKKFHAHPRKDLIEKKRKSRTK